MVRDIDLDLDLDLAAAVASATVGGGPGQARRVLVHPARRGFRMASMSFPTHPVTGTPAQARSIKRRLLDRVADSDETHLTVAADDGCWQPFGDGVQIKVLHEDDGVMSYLLRLQPGASLPAHRHPIDEECIVLVGTLRVGTRIEVGPGGYHRAHQGALHAPIGTATGATIFLRGAVPLAEHALG